MHDKMEKINSEFYVDKKKQLGKGNFGVVYKGYMLSQNKIIAVKFMSQQMLTKNADYQRQITVMQDLSKLNHPHIMGYYGYEKNKDGLYCFIEFCSGGSLKDLVKRKISQIKVLTLYKQLLQAMSYINSLNKVHRDLKPDNILLDGNLQLKIADFGLARDIQVLMTQGACTPLFASPEVFNLQTYDQKCDVWSAGLILYEMLTGKQIFAHVHKKAQLKEEFLKFKRGQRKINYSKQIHKQWSLLTQKMLTYDKITRPTFSQLLKYFQTVEQKMAQDINTKYGFDATNQAADIRKSKMRYQQINPYHSRGLQGKADPDTKFDEQKSFKKFTSVQKYLLFLRMKTDFLNKIIKAFTTNPYSVLKNVYKYILMFLSVSCYISRLSQNLAEIKSQKIKTPHGIVETKDIVQGHRKQWQELLKQYKQKHISNIQKFKGVLQKQIVSKISGSYMKRDQQNKIVLSYKEIIPWIQQTQKGLFNSHQSYMKIFVQIMNQNQTYCTQPQLTKLADIDVKTYCYIRLVGQLDSFFPDSEYQNEDFIQMKRQELQNMKKHQMIQFIKKYNNPKK